MGHRTAITYHQLQTFVAVARSGNLTQVARDVKATQPTVSLQLGALRKALGMPLFERPGGRFRLTPAGEKLRRYAEEALEGLRTLQQEISVLKGSLTGSLGVGVSYFVLGHILPGLPRFRAQFPGVDVQLHVDLPEPLFNQLLANTLDVACYLKVQTPPGLTVEPLGQAEFVIIASQQHRLAGRRRISAEELSKEVLIVSSVSAFRELVEARLRSLGVTPRLVTEARNYDAVKELVERNLGYTLHLKPLAASDVATGRFATLRLDGPPILGEIVGAFRSRRGVAPLIEEFIRFARGELRLTQGGGGPDTRTRATPRRPARRKQRRR